MNLAVIGAQWGDEGKGKLIDILSEDVDVTVRYQGGTREVVARWTLVHAPVGVGLPTTEELPGRRRAAVLLELCLGPFPARALVIAALHGTCGRDGARHTRCERGYRHRCE